MSDTTKYYSGHTGAQVDLAASNTPETIAQASLDALDPETVLTSKLFIVIDGNNKDTLWRSNGTKFVQLTSTGGGGGGGGSSSVRPLINLSDVPAGSSRLAGLAVSGTTYKVTYIDINETDECITFS